MKSFEIFDKINLIFKIDMMNCKLEKFWNQFIKSAFFTFLKWTVNLKSFEILIFFNYDKNDKEWTVNLKSFEMYGSLILIAAYTLWTVNLKSFEISYYAQVQHYLMLWTVNLKSFEIFCLLWCRIYRLYEL